MQIINRQETAYMESFESQLKPTPTIDNHQKLISISNSF